MTTIIEKAKNILKLIDDFQWQINDLDAKYNLKHYNIMCYDFSEDPMNISIFKHDENNVPVATLKINFTDLLYTNPFVSDLDNELKKLQQENTNASQEQIDELKKIREIFGV